LADGLIGLKSNAKNLENNTSELTLFTLNWIVGPVTSLAISSFTKYVDYHSSPRNLIVYAFGHFENILKSKKQIVKIFQT
jgi:hypothetical protein